MKKIYQRYKDWFVIGLFCLFCFKSCQSCSRNRMIEFSNAKHVSIIDSMKNDIITINHQNDSLNNIIQLQQMEILSKDALIQSNNTMIETYKEETKHYRNTNRVLINTNNQIINKDN